jgi:hypothetical protein
LLDNFNGLFKVHFGSCFVTLCIYYSKMGISGQSGKMWLFCNKN